MTDEQKDALRAAAREALQVQDACNLSGVLHSWAKHQRVLMDVCNGNANTDYRTHPVNVLFLSKVTSLMMVSADAIGCVTNGEDRDAFITAMRACNDLKRTL